MGRRKTEDGRRVGMTVRFSEATAAQIDARRGQVPRSEWLHGVVLDAIRSDSREEILRRFAPPEPLLSGLARDSWLVRYGSTSASASVSHQEPPEPAPVQSPAPEAARPAQPFQGRRSFTPAEPVPVSPVEHFHDAGHWDETTGTFRPCGCDQYD